MDAVDKDGDGSISSEECMEMIMHRYGRSRLDEIFRNDAGEREITLSDFLLQVNRSAKGSKMPQIKGSTKGGGRA